MLPIHFEKQVGVGVETIVTGVRRETLVDTTQVVDDVDGESRAGWN